MEKIKALFSEPGPYEHDFNEMLSCELVEKDELWLHIEDVRGMSLSEKRGYLLQGLYSLAKLLQEEPKLANVKKISGMSWIVSKNPKLVQSFGFSVADNLDGLEKQKAEYDERKSDRVVHQNQEPGYAYIEREKFIELYGASKSQKPLLKSVF